MGRWRRGERLGLESVELVLEVEEAFGVTLPDASCS